ncbi:MAG: F0F1 ATP synthase subunit A [Paludibacter sp.]|nr:F0F1 ATP synthase subunit A [Paludibacter sp.]
MSSLHKIFGLIAILAFMSVSPVMANEPSSPASSEKGSFDVKSFILEHVGDSYQWHITKWGNNEISIPLPVIVYSKTTGWHVFLSSALLEGASYEGLSIAVDGKYKGKIVEKTADGNEVRPFDISITKVVFALLFNSLLLIIIIMSVARSYKKDNFESKKGFVGFMEMFIMNINDDVIKPGIGKDYKRYAPYLLTVFFFVFINNLMGLIPIFPGGANVTGNIAITFVLAIITFIIVNISGSKEYWKEIFWPEVPLWLKAPIPIMPAIEIVGVFTKPFALMIRLFANMIAGHSIVLGLTCLIFVTVSMGQAMNTSMTVVSVIMTLFINIVELLVAYIQAYIFTMLSAVFIGLARIEPHHVHEEIKE